MTQSVVTGSENQAPTTSCEKIVNGQDEVVLRRYHRLNNV